MEDRLNSLKAASARLHALDNLRALMMWLGIVLHVAVLHVVGHSPLPWRDEARSRLADLLMAFIHVFRMPMFFILAGFFAALLLAGRGPRGMARQRLALPFALYRRRWAAYAVAGLPLFLLSLALYDGNAPAGWVALAYNGASWLWCFALIGLALRVLDARRPLLAYLAESSYWVYLVHYPLTIAFGALLYGPDLPAELKMLINIAATTAVCLASYQLVVRSTWVGALLNGRRHAPQVSLIPNHVTTS